MHPFACYCIKADNSHRTYVGVTNNLVRQIRQHNKEIKRGAKYTSSSGHFIAKQIINIKPMYYNLRFLLHGSLHVLHLKSSVNAFNKSSLPSSSSND